MLIDSGWMLLAAMIGGLIVGVVLGAMPGIAVSLAVALMLIPSGYMDFIPAIIFLSSVYTGGVYGGGITAILLNIPGSPSSVATAYDGYPMTRKGQFNEALGLGLGSSIIGVFVAYVALLFFMLPLARFVLNFGPPEMLMIVVFALTIIGLVRGDLVKSILGGAFGLLLGTVGSGPLGHSRGTFGFHELYEGIPFIVALIGLFAISECLYLVDREKITDVAVNIKTDIRIILRSTLDIFKYKLTMVYSGLIGVIVGMIPAAGSTVASIIAYGQARNWSKDGDKFGTGVPEAIVAGETANNSSEPGAMATMLAFGIPGGGATAILLAAFMMHGIVPGPYLVREHMDVAYAVIVANLMLSVILFFIAIVFVFFVGKVVNIPSKILIPVIALLATLGIAASRGSMVDVYLMVGFGFIGYVMRRLDYPLISVVLGVILGGMLDGHLIRTHRLYEGRWELLLSRPIFLGIIIITILVVVGFNYFAHRKALEEQENIANEDL